MGKEVTLTKDNFKQEVLESDVPVLVDFWAAWCVPCKMVAPVLEELSDDYDGKAKIGKVNVDDQGDLAMEYGVSSIPTLVVFKGGEVVNKHIGAGPKETIENLFKEYVN